MRLILPTQQAPTEPCVLGPVTLSPYRRVRVEKEGMNLFLDSMVVESETAAVEELNAWMVFHAFIFSDDKALFWYEGPHANIEGKLPVEGDCSSLVDYSNIGDSVYFLDKYEGALNYTDLYNIYLATSDDNRNLIKSYLNVFTDFGVRTNRAIRDTTFTRIVNAFAVIENVIGDIPKCSKPLNCPEHGVVPLQHNLMGAKDWFKLRFGEIVKDSDRAEEYVNVVWEVRQKMRHQTVHAAASSNAKFILQDERGVTYDWAKTQQEWISNSAALLDLTIRTNSITKYLLMNKIFEVDFFPPLRSLRSTRLGTGI